jgi:hypothetical protein
MTGMYFECGFEAIRQYCGFSVVFYLGSFDNPFDLFRPLLRRRGLYIKVNYQMVMACALSRSVRAF